MKFSLLNFESIDLCGNDITETGGYPLANALLVNHGLAMVNLVHNFLTFDVCCRILECAKVS